MPSWAPAGHDFLSAALILWQNGARARLKREKIDRLPGRLFYHFLWLCGPVWNVYETLASPILISGGQTLCTEGTKRLNDKCREWRRQEHISYSVYGTPMESTTHKFFQVPPEAFRYSAQRIKLYYKQLSGPCIGEVWCIQQAEIWGRVPEAVAGRCGKLWKSQICRTTFRLFYLRWQFIYIIISYAELNVRRAIMTRMLRISDGEMAIKEDESGKLIWECPNQEIRSELCLAPAEPVWLYRELQFWNQGRTQGDQRDRVLHL